MSLISDFRKAVSKMTAGAWSDTSKPAANQQPIGGFEKDEDAAFVILATKIAPHVGPVYDVLTAINGRSILGVTYLTKANRDAIASLVKKLEA